MNYFAANKNATLAKRHHSGLKKVLKRLLTNQKGGIYPNFFLNLVCIVKQSSTNAHSQRKNKTGTSQVGAISKLKKRKTFFGKKLEIFEKKFLSENVA